MVIANNYLNFLKSCKKSSDTIVSSIMWVKVGSLVKYMQVVVTFGYYWQIQAHLGNFCPPLSVHLLALLDFQLFRLSISTSCFLWPFFPFFKYQGYCNYGGGDNYKRALIPRRSPTKRRANCARKWISPWCRKSYHVSLSNETNIQRKPKDENIPKLQ